MIWLASGWRRCNWPTTPAARAELKRDITAGVVSVAELLRHPVAPADRCSVAELLISQRGWGRRRAAKLLADEEIGEAKLLGDLAQRQRRLLAARLERQSGPREEPSPHSPTAPHQADGSQPH